MSEELAAEPLGGSWRRYGQLAVLVLVGGCVYPLVYLRQNYEVTMLEAFGVSIGELAGCYALLGAMFMATYLPSGWLADRVSCRGLITFSLAATGALGLWFATLPGLTELRLIYLGWGISTGLTFWSALIKAVAVLAQPAEQGRFFGILDGGRGLVEAALATIAVSIFAWVMADAAADPTTGLERVIVFYVACLFVMAPVAWLTVDDTSVAPAPSGSGLSRTLLVDLKDLFRRPELWLVAFIILCGYQLVWATASTAAFLQQAHGMTAVTVGVISVAQLWMRPLGAVGAGVLGDLTGREQVLAGLFLLASLAVGSMILVPSPGGDWLMLAIALIVALATFAVRGLYWGSLESCQVPARSKGLAIGAISLIGYSPDLYLPLVYGALLEAFPGRPGFSLYFGAVGAMGFAGAIAAWVLARRVRGSLNSESP
ncbi:MAG: MFS transporter [Pseudomonadota bacterium]